MEPQPVPAAVSCDYANAVAKIAVDFNAHDDEPFVIHLGQSALHRLVILARELLNTGSPRPGHAQVDKYNNVGYGTSGMWLEPLAILPEAERLIEGELSVLGNELMDLQSEQ